MSPESNNVNTSKSINSLHEFELSTIPSKNILNGRSFVVEKDNNNNEFISCRPLEIHENFLSYFGFGPASFSKITEVASKLKEKNLPLLRSETSGILKNEFRDISNIINRIVNRLVLEKDDKNKETINYRPLKIHERIQAYFGFGPASLANIFKFAVDNKVVKDSPLARNLKVKVETYNEKHTYLGFIKFGCVAPRVQEELATIAGAEDARQKAIDVQKMSGNILRQSLQEIETDINLLEKPVHEQDRVVNTNDVLQKLIVARERFTSDVTKEDKAYQTFSDRLDNLDKKLSKIMEEIEDAEDEKGDSKSTPSVESSLPEGPALLSERNKRNK